MAPLEAKLNFNSGEMGIYFELPGVQFVLAAD